MGDLIFSIGVLVSSIIILYYQEYTFCDPLCTLLFGIIVVCTTIPVIRDVVLVLMEAVPSSIDLEELKSSILNVDGVKCIEQLRVWSLTLERVCVCVKVRGIDGVEAHVIRRNVENILPGEDVYVVVEI